MVVDLTITNAKIYTRQGFLEGGIAIEDGKIYKIAKEANLPKASSTVNGNGHLVLPGLIDVHVHLRDLKLSYKEDFYSGTCAAAAGGFTTILDMPNTKPPTNTSSRLKEKMELANDRVMVNVGFYADFPSYKNDFKEIAGLGGVGFKVNLYHPTTELEVEDDRVLKDAFRQAALVMRPVTVHAEDHSIVEELEKRFQRAGETSPQAYLKAHPPRAELKSIQRTLSLAKNVGVQLHFSHVSVASSLSLIREAKNEGMSVTCEATPHHLLLASDELSRLGGVALMDPPLRGRRNVLNLWRALAGSFVDVIASDHAPHAREEKEESNVWKIPPGIPGLETTLPLLLTKVREGSFSLGKLVELLAEKPVQIFRLGNRGSINHGFEADLTVVDLKERFTIDSSRFYSKAKYSPFDGWQVVGRPVKTFVGGVLVMDGGEIVAKPGTGDVVRVL